MTGAAPRPAGLFTPDQAVRVLAGYAGSPARYAAALAEVLRRFTGARCAVVLRSAGDRDVDILSVSPALPGGMTPPWIRRAGECALEVIRAGTSHHESCGASPSDGVLLVVPLPQSSKSGGQSTGASVALACVVDGDESFDPTPALERAETIAAIAWAYSAGPESHVPLGPGHRLRQVLDVVAGIAHEERFRPAAFGLCNHIASAWRCERVALGIVRGAMMRVEAVSHTEKIVHASRLVQDMTEAMEECLDQDLEIIVPVPQSSPGQAAEASGPGVLGPGAYVCRQTEEFIDRHGPAWVCTIPLRRAGNVVGALLVEREPDRPMETGEIEGLRLVCDLVTTRLADLADRDRWLVARAAAHVRRSAASFIGPEHTWAKLLAILAAGVVAFSLVFHGTHHAAASFVVMTQQRRVVPAPFDGYLAAIDARPGDEAKGGQTVLGSLETSDLRLQLAEAQARRATATKEGAIALSQGKTADAQIAQASEQEAQARISLLENRIRAASLVAPIDGVVISTDLSDRVGGVVRLGEPLFEVAPLDSLLAELLVPEDEIADVAVGQRGHLATVSRPEDRISFTVRSISPLAEVHEGKNVFRVRADLDENRHWLRPGMEGVAKVQLGSRSYAFLWTRRLVNWVRMNLWL